MGKITWSSEEIEALKRFYPKKTQRQLAQMLGKTKKGVEWKLAQLGLRKIDRWTSDEVRILNELYPIATRKEILSKLNGRTWRGVTMKARKMGISRKNVASYPPKPLNPLSEGRKGYIAGLFDGEGSYYMTKTRETRFQISNTNLDALKKVKEMIGYGYISERKKVKKGYKKQYILQIGGRANVLQLFEAINDYLIIKKEVALRAIEELRKWVNN